MRHAFVDHENKLVLCWTPKCACTTLTLWFFYGRLGLSPKDLSDGLDERAWLSDNGHMAHGIEIDGLLGEGYDSIALTRDPLDRAISAYVSKFIYGYKRLLPTFDDLEIFAKAFYMEIKGVDETTARESYQGISFEEFMGAINAAVKRRSGEPKLNTHWNTQRPFRWAERDIRPAQIFDISQTLEMVEMLNAKTGAKWVPDQKMNPTDYGEGGRYVGNVPSSELAKGGDIPSKSQFTSPKTDDLVRKAYAVDYSLNLDQAA